MTRRSTHIAGFVASPPCRSLSLRWLLGSLAACIAALNCCGCASKPDYAGSIRAAYQSGQAAPLQKRFVELSDDADEQVRRLDAATLALIQGNPTEAESLLRTARDETDHLSQKSGVEQVASMTTDDRAVAWSGRAYERQMIRSLLMLTSLLTDAVDATAYSFQALEFASLQREDGHEQIVEHSGAPADVIATASFESQRIESSLSSPVDPGIGSFAAWLSAMRIEETHVNYDDARKLLAKAESWSSGPYNFERDKHRLSNGVHSAPDHGTICVIAFVGSGPVWHPSREEATSNALLIADRILSHISDHELPPTIAPVMVAKPVAVPDRMEAVEVSIVGETAPLGSTETIESISGAAVRDWQQNRDAMLARAVVRRILKKSAMYAVQDAANLQKGSAAGFAVSLLGSAWEATEKADTRSWNLLPDRIQVLRLERPAGVCDLQLRVRGPLGRPLDISDPDQGRVQQVRVRVASGLNSYVFVTVPDGFIGAPIVGPDHARPLP